MAKQVADFRAGHGMEAKESDEQLRRWKKEDWPKHQRFGNYNPTMEHLNFEIIDGVIQPINKEDSIPGRLARRLAQLGIEDPNLRRGKKNIRTLGKYIFEGSRDRMQEMAFGHTINHSIDTDFSDLKRTPEIEHWAKDIYDFVCKEYGRDNVISFVVHLDELNPHCHASIVPISKEGRLSYKDVFLGGGETKEDCRQASLSFHTRLHDEVNFKYGLDRGDPVELTGAKHRTTEEYRRELNHEVSQLETKIKSFHTMIENLKSQHSLLLKQIVDVQEQYSQGMISKELLDQQLKKLNEDKEFVENKLNQRRGQLVIAEDEYNKLVSKNNTMESKIKVAETELDVLHEQFDEHSAAAVASGFLSVAMDSIFDQREQCKYFMERAALENTDLWYFGENWNEIWRMTVHLLMGGSPYNFVPSGGGGSSASDLPWDGKKKDEENDILWAARCARTALRAHKKGFRVPGGRESDLSGGRGGGRGGRR